VRSFERDGDSDFEVPNRYHVACTATYYDLVAKSVQPARQLEPNLHFHAGSAIMEA
jgi:hypothetical protein